MATAADEEQAKKDTDCVYFLASPLTCKKGNDCEFRHSESARMNPRDCWYWLHSKCLNGDCPFRHPPMDGRPVASSPSSLQVKTSTSGKAPCYYYSHGYCAKGDRCPFLHGKSPSSNSQVPALQKSSSAAVGNAVEVHDKSTANVNAGTPKMTVKLTSTAGKTNSQAVKPSNVWRLSSEPQNRGSSAPESKPVKPVPAKPALIKGDECVPGSKKSRNGSDKYLQVSEGNSVLQSRKTWSRQEQMLGKEQNGQHKQLPKLLDERVNAACGEPVVVSQHKDSVYPLDEDAMQELSKERHVSGRSKNSWLKNASYGQDPSVFEGRAISDAGMLYDNGASGDDEDQHHRHGYSNYEEVQQMAYLDGVPVAQEGFVIPDRRRVRQGSQERKNSTEREGRTSVGAEDLRNHLVKRRRLNEAQPSVENRLWVQASDDLYDNVKQGRRIQGDYSDDIPEQMFLAKQGIRPANRRGHEMDMKQQEVKIHRRISHPPSSNPTMDTVLKVMPKTVSRVHSANEQPKKGGRGKDDVDGLKPSDSSVYDEHKSSVPRMRKSEIRKEVSDFAPPKSLAQIKAEKENIGIEKTNGDDGSFPVIQSDDEHCEFPQDIRSKTQPEFSRVSFLVQKDETFPTDGKKLIETLDMRPEVPVPKVSSNYTSVAGKHTVVSKRQLQSVAVVDECPTMLSVKESNVKNPQPEAPYENLLSEDEDGEVTPLKFRPRDLGETTFKKLNDRHVAGVEAAYVTGLASGNSEVDVEQWTRHGYRHGNGAIFETSEDDHAEGHDLKYRGRSFEAPSGEPGDDIAMVDDEDEDDFAKKLGGYFS